MLSLMFLLVTVNAQAAVIVLKDGRTVTGEIDQQDDTKVVLKVDKFFLTYYKDKIVSISADAEDNSASRTYKEKLVQQYLSYDRTRDMVSNWVIIRYHPGQWPRVLAAINSDQYVLVLTKMRAQGLTEYLSSADLKAVDDFYASPAGKQFLADYKQYSIHALREIYIAMKTEATKVIKRNEK